MTTTEPTPEATADMDRLREEVQRLRRWKAEASEVMIGLQDLGRALDIPLGKRITGTLAAEIAGELRAKVARIEALADEFDKVIPSALSDGELRTVGKYAVPSVLSQHVTVHVLAKVAADLRTALEDGS